MEDDRPETEPVATGGIAAEVEGGVAGEQIDLPGAQGCEAFWSRQRSVLDAVRISEERRGHRSADINVEAFVSAVGPQKTHPRNLAADSADQLPALLDEIQTGAVRAVERGTGTEQCRQTPEGPDRYADSGSDHGHGTDRVGLSQIRG